MNVSDSEFSVPLNMRLGQRELRVGLLTCTYGVEHPIMSNNKRERVVRRGWVGGSPSLRGRMIGEREKGVLRKGVRGTSNF